MNYQEQLTKDQAELKKASKKYKSLLKDWSEADIGKSEAFYKDIMRPLQNRIAILEQIVSLEEQLNDCN